MEGGRRIARDESKGEHLLIENRMREQNRVEINKVSIHQMCNRLWNCVYNGSSQSECKGCGRAEYHLIDVR